MNTLYLDKIPDELKAKDQWVLWRYEGRNGRPTKIPCQANGWPARTDDATTWTTFNEAVAAYNANRERFAGIGFVFAPGDNLVGIDLDHSIAPDGAVMPWAIPYLNMLGTTYSEVSPSRRGIKIWCHGSLSGPGLSVKGGFDPNDPEAGIEVYDRGRYFCVTGNALGNSLIEDHQAAVDAIEKDLQARKAAKRGVKSGPAAKGGKRPTTFAKSTGTALPSGRKVVAKLGVPTTMAVNGKTYDTAVVVDRALAYLDETDPSIQGQNGSAQMLWACRVVQVGYAMRGKLARAVIGWFNKHKCNPRWTGDELAHKIREGRDAPFDKPKGWLLDGATIAPTDDPRGPLTWRMDPQPVKYELPPVPTMGADMLPEPFRDWVEDIANRVGCPTDFVAVGAMVSLAIVVGCRVGIRPKRHDDWTVTPNLWGAVVGRPGVLKTPALVEAQRPLNRLVAERRDRHAANVAEHEKLTMVLALQVKAAKKALEAAIRAKKDPAIIAQLASEVQGIVMPKAPIAKRYVTTDPTIEALGELLRDNPNGVGLTVDELTGWLARLERPDRAGDRPFYLSGWNGSGSYDVDRIGRGHVHIPNMCLSILGSIQPDPLRKMLRYVASGKGGDDGLITRFQLLVWPDVPSNWRNVDRWPDTAAKNRAFDIFDNLDQANGEDIGATPGEGPNDPPFVRFDDDAQTIFDEWRERLELRIRGGESMHPLMESHLSKYRSLMPSLALLFHLVEWADGRARGGVGAGPTRLAVRWCEHLESHAMRVYSSLSDVDLGPPLALAERIMAGQLPGRFTPRDVYRRGWANLGRDETESAIARLEELGWMQTREAATTGQGGRPTMIVHLHPSLPRRPANFQDVYPGGTDETDKTSPDGGFVSFVSSSGVDPTKIAPATETATNFQDAHPPTTDKTDKTSPDGGFVSFVSSSGVDPTKITPAQASGVGAPTQASGQASDNGQASGNGQAGDSGGSLAEAIRAAIRKSGVWQADEPLPPGI